MNIPKYAIKPCPFCGNGFPVLSHEYYSDTFCIRCPDCQIVFSCDCSGGRDKSVTKLMDAWNRRAVQNETN